MNEYLSLHHRQIVYIRVQPGTQLSIALASPFFFFLSHCLINSSAFRCGCFCLLFTFLKSQPMAGCGFDNLLFVDSIDTHNSENRVDYLYFSSAW